MRMLVLAEANVALFIPTKDRQRKQRSPDKQSSSQLLCVSSDRATISGDCHHFPSSPIVVAFLPSLRKSTKNKTRHSSNLRFDIDIFSQKLDHLVDILCFSGKEMTLFMAHELSMASPITELSCGFDGNYIIRFSRKV